MRHKKCIEFQASHEFMNVPMGRVKVLPAGGYGYPERHRAHEKVERKPIIIEEYTATVVVGRRERDNGPPPVNDNVMPAPPFRPRTTTPLFDFEEQEEPREKRMEREPANITREMVEQFEEMAESIEYSRYVDGRFEDARGRGAFCQNSKLRKLLAGEPTHKQTVSERPRTCLGTYHNYGHNLPMVQRGRAIVGTSGSGSKGSGARQAAGTKRAKAHGL